MGIEVSSAPGQLHLSQSKYIRDLLLQHDMSSTKPVSTPGSVGKHLSQHDGTLLPDPTDYRRIVGSLQYATMTRPDISFAVNRACQFMHAPTTSHWLAVKRILRYLSGTISHGITLSGTSSFHLSAYSDADWASCLDERRSTSGYCVFIGDSLISWTSSKQRVVSRSSTEAEYRSLANAAAEITWFKQLFS